jgi:AraC-like DNA-binding protein
MNRIDTTNPKAHQGTQTIFCTATGDRLGQLAEKFRMHLLGMYFNTVGSEWGSAGKQETDYVHHIDISLTGRRQVLLGKTVYQFEPGQVWYLPANKPVARRCCEICEVLYFKFFCDCLPGVDLLMDWPEREPRLIGQIDVTQWRQWLEPKRTTGVAELLRLRCQLLIWMTDGIPELDEIITHHLNTHAKFSKVFQWIEEHLGADLRLPSLAAAYGRGTTAFAEAFSHDIGITPKEYLTRRLNQEALQWIINSDLNMKQIAVKLRFSDEFYFSRFFQRLNGMPPSRYRSNFRGTSGTQPKN